MSTEFQWTEELIKEFAELYRFSSSRITIEQFKESKQPKKVIITTEDGVDYYENEKKDIYGVHTKEGFNSAGAWKADVHSVFYTVLKEHYEHFFSTKELANEWILNNKPLLTLNEIKKYGLAQENNPYYKKLVDIAKSKLK